MKILKILDLSATFLILFSLQASFLIKPVSAQTFNPAFGVELSDNTPQANSNITITTTQPAGDELLNQATVKIPAGWTVSSGTGIPDGAVVANGSLSFVYQGSPQSINFTFENQANTQGHTALWRFVMPAPYCCLSVPVDGNSSDGYSFMIKPQLPVQTPINFTVILQGLVTGIPILANPAMAGDYTWSADFTAPSGATATKSQILSIPGTTTPAGDNISVLLSGNVSVTFDTVATEGTTSIATSTTAPPNNTGQFQLVPGGLYYDFHTTATISCPCTVTLPYDPQTTNPRIYHLVSGVWEDATTSVDTINHTVTGVVSSFSFFAVGQPNFSVNWRAPLEKGSGKTAEFNVKIPIIPITYSLLDSKGKFVERKDTLVQIIKGGVVVAKITPQVVAGDGRLYLGFLKVHELGLRVGEYTAEIKVGNTITSPSVNFILK